MKLKKISQAELDEIIKQHQKWIGSGGVIVTGKQLPHN